MHAQTYDLTASDAGHFNVDRLDYASDVPAYWADWKILHALREPGVRQRLIGRTNRLLPC